MASKTVENVLRRLEADGYAVERDPSAATVLGPGCEGTQPRPGLRVDWSGGEVRLNGDRVAPAWLGRKVRQALQRAARSARQRTVR